MENTLAALVCGIAIGYILRWMLSSNNTDYEEEYGTTCTPPQHLFVPDTKRHIIECFCGEEQITMDTIQNYYVVKDTEVHRPHPYLFQRGEDIAYAE